MDQRIQRVPSLIAATNLSLRFQKTVTRFEASAPLTISFLGRWTFTCFFNDLMSDPQRPLYTRSRAFTTNPFRARTRALGRVFTSTAMR